MTFPRLVAALALLSLAKAEDVNISIQPAYHAIPIWAAYKYGWFSELGLNVKLSVYDSGLPQVNDAYDNDAWDIGIAGSPPNVLGGAKGMKTVAINNDESYTTEIIGAPNVAKWPPTAFHDGIIAVTPKSTGELLLRHCLNEKGLSNVGPPNVTMAKQPEVIELLKNGTSDYGVLWAPNTYTYRFDEGTAQILCSGRDVGFPIYGGVMVRDEWAKDRPETVKKVLAAYLRGITFMQNALDEEEVIRLSKEYHVWSKTGDLNDLAVKNDLHLRPLFNLDQQLDHLSRNFANDYTSDADRHYIELEQFLLDEGVIDVKNKPKEYITDEYMTMISDDPYLRAYSYLGAADFSHIYGTASSGYILFSGPAMVGIVLSLLGGGVWSLL